MSLVQLRLNQFDRKPPSRNKSSSEPRIMFGKRETSTSQSGIMPHSSLHSGETARVKNNSNKNNNKNTQKNQYIDQKGRYRVAIKIISHFFRA
jgi:hypothetical protein